MNGVQTRFKCKLDVKRCKRFVFPPSSLLPRSNALKTKAIRYFQTDRTLTRIVSPPLSGNRSLMGCCVLAFSPLSKEEIFPFIKITHNSRYSFKYTWFFIEFIRCLLEYEDKEQALQQAEQRCDVEVNRQNLCNGSFVVDTVESVVNWFMAGNSYKECVFSAINSGKSSDAVGALTGLLAGIYYGLELKNGVKGFETMESYIDSFIQYLNHPTL